MPNLASFRAFLIGADSLLLECAALLLERGHELAGIVSDAPRLRAWASERGVRTLPLAGYPEALRDEPFDYLFSITHLAMIPEAVLRLPRRAAINFHDGPLPRYAGLNAPAWALLHGEREYGISWHLIVPGGAVDEGAVLEQRLFEIAPGETSLSLNTRNFASAIDSFAELVDKLASGSATPQAQDLSARSYFGKFMRPAAACVLDLERPAAELQAAVRALDFGDYDNPLGSAKLVHRGQPFLVRRAELRAEVSAAAGCVSAVSAAALELATGEGTLLVQELADPHGQSLTPLAAAQAWQLEPGMQLDGLAPALRDWLTEHATHLARSEEFWLSRLRNLEPATLALARNARVAHLPNTPHVPHLPVALELPLAHPARALAVLCAYLARTSGKTEFDLGYQAVAYPPGLQGFFVVQMPLRVHVDETAGFETLVAALETELATLATRAPCFRDLYARHASLRAHPELRNGELADVALIRQRVLPPGVALALSLDESGNLALLCDPERLPDAERALLCAQLLHLMAAAEAEPHAPIGELLLLPAAERALLASWNDTRRPLPDARASVHGAFEAQCARTPDRTALIFEDRELGYAQLNTLAERLAVRLRAEGVGRDSLVGVFVERGLSLLVATLGIWKAGGAYLPLDPSYPAERLRFMREDSGAKLIVSEESLAEQWPAGVQVIDVVQSSAEYSAPEVRGADLAYVIYTSGSTGKPKGVMVEHRQVLNFFAGMDEVVPQDRPNPVWLSVTSLSFDISVLELFWTLARGFSVVVYRDRARDLQEPVSRTMRALRARGRRPLDFSLFLWGAQDTRSDQTYRLMLEAARFGDQHGFAAIWTPERHFHAFGGPYPNPSVTGAALAAITERMQIRAGSCVVPLHHPARVAEEWAVVDNISNGRVGISFASGWQPDDFLLRPENYRENKRVMVEQIDQVRRLWRGEELSFAGPLGNPVQVRTQPRPIQAELPFWLTAAGSPDTFAMAGRLGANLLTHLLGQSLDELTHKIAIYRRARADAGFDADSGVVTLMLHTFVGSSVSDVRARVREPMKQYLKSSVHLIKNFAWAFPAFKRPAGQGASPDAIDIAGLSAEELDAVLEFAFERYFESSGLFGTPESCLPMLERLQTIGVDDVACLIDFGVPTEEVLSGLVQLAALRERAAQPSAPPTVAEEHALPLAEQIARYQVTHLQCTPSLLRMARGDDSGRAAIDGVPHLFLGGEAFPADLAGELAGHSGSVTNMYGPTETTVWSATHRLQGAGDDVPLGRPIANTRLHVLDAQQRPLPIGVPGELYIAGAGVVRGYHARPELTQERFVPDPFAADGGRMYRTGDLVRWSASGVLEFLGRLDQQVKIRGHRIELGEIEALLLRQPGVREAAVIAREDSLVAYFCGAAGEDALREAARASLPEYMLPAVFVQLSELPHTPNGKLDRKALPAPEKLAAPVRTYTAPENELERKVVALWCEVLGVSQVGVHDNFFDIGGHSLLVVKLHRRLKAELAPELALTDVYRFPSVRALVGQIARGDDNQAVEQGQDRAALRLERLSARRDLAQRRRPR